MHSRWYIDVEIHVVCTTTHIGLELLNALATVSLNVPTHMKHAVCFQADSFPSTLTYNSAGTWLNNIPLQVKSFIDVEHLVS